MGTTVEPYQPGDLMLLGPDLPHTFSSVPYPTGMAEASVVQFRHDFLGADFFALPQFRPVQARSTGPPADCSSRMLPSPPGAS